MLNKKCIQTVAARTVSVGEALFKETGEYWGKQFHSEMGEFP